MSRVEAQAEQRAGAPYWCVYHWALGIEILVKCISIGGQGVTPSGTWKTICSDKDQTRTGTIQD